MAGMRKRRQLWKIAGVLSATLLISLSCLVALPSVRTAALIGLGRFLVLSEPLEQADLIYVLAGDFFGNRVLLGADLGARGYAKQVLLSGGPYNDKYESDMAVDFAVEHGYPRSLFCPVRLGVQSTIDEARAMGSVFDRMGAKRIILVTSSFHSRRAALVFRLFLPRFRFRMAAASVQEFDPGSWWKQQQSRHLFYSEYQKMLGTLLIRFGSVATEAR
jgi:uncharacterized SAM-binding protein YcdF (DUF218 family)